MYGTPTTDNLGSCTSAFSVTDGAHSSAQSYPITVHAGVIVSSDSWYGTSHSMGVHEIGTVGTALLTVTSQESIEVGFSIEGLPNGDFSYAGGTFPGAGGTCGATLGAGASCTIDISFAPTVDGGVSVPVEIRFTNEHGLVSYTFTLSGHGG